jgi:hypothetical protein
MSQYIFIQSGPRKRSGKLFQCTRNSGTLQEVIEYKVGDEMMLTVEIVVELHPNVKYATPAPNPKMKNIRAQCALACASKGTANPMTVNS